MRTALTVFLFALVRGSKLFALFVFMLTLSDNEKVLAVVHKHWFVMVGPIITFAALIFAPIIVIIILPFITKGFDQMLVEVLTDFSLSLYIMILLLFMFLIWMDFYLDMWIITSKRIIDIEQRGLFFREIAVRDIPRLYEIKDLLLKYSQIERTAK